MDEMFLTGSIVPGAIICIEDKENEQILLK